MPSRVLVTLLLSAVMLPACTGVRRFAYDPRPTSVVLTDPDGHGSARVGLSVSEVRDPSSELPRSIEVRTRVENTGRRGVAFDPASLELIAGNLVAFPAPLLEFAQPVTIAPGSQVTTTAWFPFPPNETVDLAGLEVAWFLDFDGTTVPGSAVLTRHRPRPRRAGYGFGYGYPHHYGHFGWYYSRHWH